ncbi:uncharacterized protein BJX67DRAFT_366441 [Aspergillus lucknowensis]|uniref:Ankyrin repeat protein n=1 Tax=Aspergillus lucknowensis TaxID=176173 RepID=A0ABR4LCY7_9EURO
MAGNFATNSERRKELLSGPEEMKFWTEMIALGCEPMDYDDEPATGLDVVDYFVTRDRKVVFDIQAEMGAGRPVEETAAGVEVLGPYGREKKAYGAKQKEWESRLREIELERSRLEQDGRAKGASLESLRSELGRMQERLRHVETKHEQKMLNARAESDTQIRHAMETLRVSEAERHKLTAANAEKDRRIGDLQTRLQTAEHAHATTVNEVNALKTQLSREKDTRRPLNYDPALNVLDSRGEFPLYRAAAGGHYAEVKSLLERGANPRLQTRFRWTSLHWAVQNGHYEVAKLLLEYGASPDVQSDTRATPRGMARTDQMRWLLRQYQG